METLISILLGQGYYLDNPLHDSPITNIGTAAACAAECEARQYCNFWTWTGAPGFYSAPYECRVFKGGHPGTFAEENLISGPRGCSSETTTTTTTTTTVTNACPSQGHSNGHLNFNKNSF